MFSFCLFDLSVYLFQSVGLATSFCSSGLACLFGYRCLSEKKLRFVRHGNIRHNCKPSQHRFVKKMKSGVDVTKKPQYGG